MSSPTQPITGLIGPADPSAGSPETIDSPLASAPQLGVPSITAGRGEAPSAVREQMLAAGDIHDRLLRAGLAICFEQVGEGPVRIAVRDREGALVQTLTLDEALALSCGEAEL